MNFKRFLPAAILAAILVLPSCRKHEDPTGEARQPKLPQEPYSYSGISTPFNPFDPSNNNNPSNPDVTNAGAALGRVLFYDSHLSLNNRIACASCHHQELAFSDNKAGSIGFEGRVTPRNSMAIINVGMNHNLFWDSRVNSVTDLVTKPILNHIEMGMENMQNLEQKLAALNYYPALFEAAFGTPEISEPRIASAMAQFLCAIQSTNSRFDQAQSTGLANLSTLEKMGHELFFTRALCSNCHAGTNFSAPDFPGGPYGDITVKGTANIGLDLVYADQGKGDGKFRIPSLRNIALTAPYMHDGRFKNLEEVVEHYNSGIQAHHELDENLRRPDGSPVRLDLNALEKKALVAFLHTLTDESMVKDVRYSDPFK